MQENKNIILIMFETQKEWIGVHSTWEIWGIL